MKKKDLIFRIIFLSTFLIASTFMVYMPKKAEFASAMSFLTTMDRLELDQVTDGIVLTKKYPVTDEVGMTNKDTIFIVKNNNTKDVKYRLKIETVKNGEEVNYLNLSNLKYVYKINDSEYSDIKNVSEDGTLDIKDIEENGQNKYSFKFWLDEDSDYSVYGSTFSAAISLNKIN